MIYSKIFIFVILLLPNCNIINFPNLAFCNTSIFVILLLFKFKFFNSLKLTFSKIFIFDIEFPSKSNISNFSKLTFANTSISEI